MFIEKLKKKSILTIPKVRCHPTCAARAIICGISQIRLDNNKYRAVARGDRTTQYNLAIDLLRKVDLPTETELTIRDFIHIENYLDCQVIVYDAPFKNSCIYGGSR